MAFPLGGNAGWEELGTTVAEPPVSRPLPVPLIADWYDPAPLNGAGAVRPSVVLTAGASTVVVRGSVEARFTQPEVWGVGLLDSIGVFNAPCALLLTVFDDDGETVLWEVGTDPLHPHPYLVNPENYGEQEVDFAEGSATLGTVTVEVIDPATIPGDQDSGFMTEKLARLGLADVAGHRCVLQRFIDDTLGFQVIMDGPAGTPSMHSNYSSYRWEIRDTRETERKVRLFEFSGDAATGLRSLVPDELMDGYGYDSPSNTYLIRPAMPLEGHTERHPFYPTPGVATILVGASEFPDQLRRLLIWQEAYDAVINGIGRAQGIMEPNIQFLFRWRASGSSDPWTEIPGDVLSVSLSTAKSEVTEGARVVGQVIIEDPRLNPLDPLYDPLVPDLPAEDQIIEFFLLGPVPTSEHHPVILDSRIVPGVAGPLNPMAALMLGRFALVASIGGVSSGLIDLLAVPGNVEELRRQTVAVYDRLGNESTTGDIFIPSRGVFAWRAAGSADPWTEITLAPAAPGGASLLAYLELPLRNTFRVFTLLQLAAADADVPTDGEDIEFTVTYPPGSPELLEVTVGLTTGQLAKNVYDGLYAPRGPSGELVPLRARYDPAALALMTTPVRLRFTEPVDDARDFLESLVYAPDGWAPALDRVGLISPVSQVAPTDSTGLPVVTNDTTEPSPAWDAGQRIVNILRFIYDREAVFADDEDAYPDPPSEDPPDPLKERQKVIISQPIIQEFRDELSIARHGEQMLELDGSAFTAIGKIPDASAELTLPPQRTFRPRQRSLKPSPVTSTPVVRTAAYIQPVSGDIADETGFQLFELRRAHLINRYSLGAPTMSVNVMRAAFPTLRAGSWVVLNLSWFPDYVTARRGLLGLAQVIAIGDLDCAWRHILVEQVVPIEPES